MGRTYLFIRYSFRKWMLVNSYVENYITEIMHFKVFDVFDSIYVNA
jgi:hypothetical protein